MEILLTYILILKPSFAKFVSLVHGWSPVTNHSQLHIVHLWEDAKLGTYSLPDYHQQACYVC